MKAKDFYIFRHGQSTYNLQGKTQGRSNDSVLTELGKMQAKDVGKRLKNKMIEIIVCSPLQRVRQTAQYVNECLGVAVEIDERFNEIDVGQAEGLYRNDIAIKFPEVYAKWCSGDEKYKDVCYPGGESREHAKLRIFEGLEYWASKKYNVVAISAHGIMLSQIMSALGKNMRDIPNGTILHIRKEKDKWKIIELL